MIQNPAENKKFHRAALRAAQGGTVTITITVTLTITVTVTVTVTITWAYLYGNVQL